MKKPLIQRVVLTYFLLGFFAVVNAQTGSQSDLSQKYIRVQVEFIDVSHEQFTELMNGDQPAANDGELRKQVSQLVKDGKATVVETLLTTAQNGQKAFTYSHEEVIYPTEYEGAVLADHTHAEDAQGTTKTPRTRIDPTVGPMPTSFEPRYVGPTLEIEPTISGDKKMIHLRFESEIVYHLGNEVWAEWKGPYGNSPLQMPKFYVLRLITTLSLTDGHYMLAAAQSPKNKEGKVDSTRKLMVFVKAVIITTEP